MNMRIVDIYELSEELSSLELPQFLSPVRAGFPSQADDHVEQELDLNQYLIRNKATTYFLRVAGDSMIGAGIHHGDLIVVDRSLDPKHGLIAVVLVDGENTVKRLHYEGDRLWLMPENEQYSPIEISVHELNDNYRVWGIVTNVIHTLYSHGGPGRL
jgi:DNA polymerase V